MTQKEIVTVVKILEGLANVNTWEVIPHTMKFSYVLSVTFANGKTTSYFKMPPREELEKL